MSKKSEVQNVEKDVKSQQEVTKKSAKKSNTFSNVLS